MVPQLDDLATALFQLANKLLSQKRLTEAANCYRQVLELKPDLVQARFNLGHILMLRHEWNDAVICYREAVRLLPNMAAAHSNLGLALRGAGQLPEAIDCFRRVLAITNDDAIAWSNLASVLHLQGKYESAVEFYRRALSLKPDHFESHNCLGTILCTLGRVDEGIACFREALMIDPNSAAAHCNMGVALRNQFKLDNAITCYCKAIELRPDCAEAFCNLGEVFKCRGDVARARICLMKALELKPDYFEAFSQLASVLGTQGELDEFIKLAEQSSALKPNSPDAYNKLGNAFKDQGQSDRAIFYYQKALELDCNFAPAHCNLGVAMQNQARIEEAVVHFRKAIRLKPNYTMAHSNLLYSMQYRDGVSLEELAEAHREYDHLYATQLHRDVPLRAVNSDPVRRLRLGFVSADFGCHPIGYFLVNVLEHLPREQFESICFSDRIHSDELTQRIRAASAEWRDVRSLDDERLARQIEADRIDILFDLSGHTSDNRMLVFARKPAPIQITWAGYVGTTGLEKMDYILADRFEIPPESERHYRERVLRMPDGYVCYAPPSVTPDVAPLPAFKQGAITFGCFNNPAKMTARIVDVWSKILQRLPGSRLLLKFRGWDDKYFAQRFRDQFGPDVRKDRILLLGPSSHFDLLSEYNQVDIALDSFPYSGGLTTCEALWMGVPVITCPGETFASRHSLSHLSNIGLTETIAQDLDEYVELAVALATDLPRLAELRASLRGQMAASPLCDGQRFAMNLSQILQDVWNDSAAVCDQKAA